MGKLIDKFKNGLRKKENRSDYTEVSGSMNLREKTDESVTNSGDDHHGKLVVVGRESAFPGDLVAYALDMAERLSYEIVALNTAPLSCETFKFFSSSRSKLCQDFQNLAEQSAAAFRDEVLKRGLSFTHVVKFCDVDEALKGLQEEIGGIDFIVSDAQQEAPPQPSNEGPRPESEIVVYAMVQ
jgi:hypothetical protein